MRRIVGLSLILLLAARPVAAQDRTASVTVSFQERLGPLQIDRMALGQGGLSPEPMWDGRVAEVRALRPAMIRLFIQEYFDLLPGPGRFHFDTLDRSVGTIRRAGAEPLMCICFKPRVLFPEVNQEIVEPSDYDAWEKLIEAMVSHYREANAGVRYWEIGNEPDIGESGGCPYRFQPESYVRYYRHTAAAILRADPEAKVGGPALANVRSPILPALLDASQQQKLPLAFVSWHIYSSDPRAIRGTIDYARAEIARRPGLSPETVLDEWNMDLMNPPRDPRFQPCFILETIWQMKEAGLDRSGYYHIRDYQVEYDRFVKFMSPGGTAFMAKWWNRMPQFDGLFDYQDNVRPSYFAFKLLSRLTGERLKLESSDPSVHGFATQDEKHRVATLLLWNFSASPAAVDLSFAHLPKEMRVRHVVLDAATASSDENARLRPNPPCEWSKGDRRLRLRLDPSAIHSWTIE